MEVHDVISQYIIQSMDSNEVHILAPFDTTGSIGEGLTSTFLQSYGVHDPSSLTVVDYLNYKLCEIENDLLPLYLKTINKYTAIDPHDVILILQQINDILLRSPYTIKLLSFLNEEINSLMGHCKQILQDAHILCRKLNQGVQKNLLEQNYDELIQTVEEFIKTILYVV